MCAVETHTHTLVILFTVFPVHSDDVVHREPVFLFRVRSFVFLIFRTIPLGLKTGYDNVRQIPDTPCIHLASLHTEKEKKKKSVKSLA